MPPRLPCLLNDPPAAPGRTWLANARLFDGTGTPVRRASLLVEDGRIAAIAAAGEDPPEGARVIDAAGRTLMPGLIDAHQHATAGSRSFCKSANESGTEAIWPGTAAHVVAQVFRELLRMGITTFRDVGGYDDLLVEARQAMRYGAFDGPRVLACGRIVSATSPGGRFFHGMYREADGADEIRKAVREQIRYGADFIKVMTTGARSVELEDPDPAQLTRDEVPCSSRSRTAWATASPRTARASPAPRSRSRRASTRSSTACTSISGRICSSAWRATARCWCRRSSCLYGMAELGERIGTSLEDAEYEGGPGAGLKRPPMPTWTSAARRPRALQRRPGGAHDPRRARRRGDDRDGLRLGPAASLRARAAAHDPHGPDAAGRADRRHLGRCGGASA